LFPWHHSAYPSSPFTSTARAAACRASKSDACACARPSDPATRSTASAAPPANRFIDLSCCPPPAERWPREHTQGARKSCSSAWDRQAPAWLFLFPLPPLFRERQQSRKETEPGWSLALPGEDLRAAGRPGGSARCASLPR